MKCQAKGVRVLLKLAFACWQFADELFSGPAINEPLLVGRHQERDNYPTTVTVSLLAHVSPLTAFHKPQLLAIGVCSEDVRNEKQIVT
jgi:hypothetical protein